MLIILPKSSQRKKKERKKKPPPPPSDRPQNYALTHSNGTLLTATLSSRQITFRYSAPAIVKNGMLIGRVSAGPGQPCSEIPKPLQLPVQCCNFASAALNKAMRKHKRYGQKEQISNVHCETLRVNFPQSA